MSPYSWTAALESLNKGIAASGPKSLETGRQVAGIRAVRSQEILGEIAWGLRAGSACVRLYPTYSGVVGKGRESDEKA